MPTNKITIPEYVAKEALRGLHNSSTLIGNCDRKYTKEFAKEGAKAGRKVVIKKPARFVATEGKSYQPQAIEEDTATITIGLPTGVHFEMDLLEATLDIDQNKADYSKRVIMPAGRALGAKVESKGYKTLAQNVNNSIVLAAAPTLKDFNRAKSFLDRNLAPIGNRISAIGSNTEVELTDSIKTLYNAQAVVDAAIRKGEISEAVGLRWMTTQLGYIHTNGGGTGKTITLTFSTSGAATCTLGGANAADAKVGDSVNLGVNLVNPETKDDTGIKAQRTIVAIAGSTATLSEPVWWNGVGQNVSAQPTSAAILGVAGQSYLVDCVYHRDAITLVNPDLYEPKNMEMSFRTDGEFDPNLSILFTRSYADGDMSLRNRLDGLFTWQVLRPEWGVRVMTPIT